MIDAGQHRILEVENLTKKFLGGQRPALDGVSFQINRGELVVISGANGSGKSVLMHLIAGLAEPTSGKVSLVAGIGRETPRVGLVFQDADAQILGDTVEEDVSFGPKNLGYDRARCAETVARVLERVGLTGRERDPARTLSGGEKRRLAVAGVLAMNAEIIIFDEPFANLDWPGVTQVITVVRQLSAEGKTIVILTHELEKILALANRLLVLFRGRIVYDGTPEAALAGQPLAEWGIRPPLVSYRQASDLVWESPE